MRSLMVLLTVLAMAHGVYAACNWSDSGSDHLWSNPDNWTSGSSNAPPKASDTTFIRIADMVAGGQGPLIQDGIDAKVRNLAFEVGSGSLLEMNMTGGSLTVYNAATSNVYLRLGAGASTGTVRLNQSGGNLIVNVDAAQYVSGINGYIRVGYGYQGELLLSNDAQVSAWDLLIGTTSGLVDLSDDARIVLKGDETEAIAGYITAGVLTSHGGTVQNVTYAYDVLTDLTTITAIPEPGTLALLSMGGLILSYKKK